MANDSAIQTKSPLDENDKVNISILWGIILLIIVMNNTMFSVAIPNIMAELKISVSSVSWLVAGYSVILAVATLTGSRLSDSFSFRKLLTISITVLTLASLLGFLSNHYFFILIARILQATGAGVISGLAFVFVSKYIHINRRGKAMSIMSSFSALGFGLGPLMGGIVTTWLDWHYLFIITMVAIFLLPLFLKAFPREILRAREKFDIYGCLLTTVAIISLMLFLTTLDLVLLLINILAVFILWRHSVREKESFIQFSLVKNKKFLLMILISIFVYFIYLSTIFILPIVLSDLHSLDAIHRGLILFPGAALSFILVVFTGRLIDQYENKVLMFLGQMLFLCSLILFAFLHHSIYIISLTFSLMSIGYSILTTILVKEQSVIISNKNIGTGMGMLKLFQYFGSSLGVNVSGVCIDWLQKIGLKMVYPAIFLGLNVIVLFSLCLLYVYYKDPKGNTGFIL